MSSNKWMVSGSGERPADLPADAISDLKTDQNTLSFYMVRELSDESEQNAILALIGSLERLDTFHVAFVGQEQFDGLVLKESDGRTFESLKKLHVDLADLTAQTLLFTANVIAEHVYGGSMKAITTGKQKQILGAALKDNILVEDDLKPKVLEQLGIRKRQPVCAVTGKPCALQVI